MRLFIFILFMLAVVIIAAGYFLSTNFSSRPSVFNPSPNPFPFQELTIPYLRQRSYQSQLLGQEELSQNADYVSYIVSYDSDGFGIYGLLTKPQGEMPPEGWPAIIFLHGYIPPQTYQTTANYIDYVDYLARSGFVVFKIDLRGHGNSEGEASGAYYSGDYIVDTLNAFEALAGSGFVDPSRIGLWGHSMAGNIVLRTMAVKTNIPAAVVWAGAVYTYSDMLEYGINDDSYRPPASASAQRSGKRNQLREIYGNFDPQKPFWQQVAATNYLSDLQGAIQLHHAMDDEVVSIEYSRNLMNLLDSTQINHQLFEYPNGGHNITGFSFNPAMQRTADFFKKFL